MEHYKAQSAAEFLLDNFNLDDIGDIVQTIDELCSDWYFTQQMYIFFKNELQRGVDFNTLTEDDVFDEIREDFFEPENEVENPKPTIQEIGNEDKDIVRESLIADVEVLYPPEQHPDNYGLVLKALALNWRTLPIEVLRTLRSLNVDKDRGL